MTPPNNSDVCDRTAKVKSFDESKTGVKGLVDSGLTTIPRIFHHPSVSLSSTSALSIPTVDLSLPRPLTVDLLCSAAREWGFFQLTNHGLPLQTLTSAISAIKSFNELPAHLKSPHYSRDFSHGVGFYTNYDLFQSHAATWRDTLNIRMAPEPAVGGCIPEACREEVVEWDQRVRELASRVMGILSEGLGVEEGRLEGMSLAEGRVMVCHYYPRCPEPDRTLGLVGHTDPGLLTILVQNHVEGLQVRKKGENGESVWVKVMPIPGAIIVNVGDLLQIISNDEYVSGEHRVVANSHQDARVSIGVFLNPGKMEASFGPLPEMISEPRQAQYRSFALAEFMDAFLSKQLGTRVLVDYFKL